MKTYVKMLECTLVCIVLLSVLACAALCAQDVPAVNVKAAAAAPVIDGELTDAAWRGAACAEPFMLYTGEKAASEQSKAYITYDKSNMYVAFVCYDSHMSELKAAKDVFKGDVVELFIDPGKSFNYTHIAANPAGETYFAWQQGNRKNNVKCAAKTFADRWQVEMAVPLAEIKYARAANAGSAWGINFCRTNPKTKENSCWSPTLVGFHNPTRFGTLNGMNVDTARFYQAQNQAAPGSDAAVSFTTDRTFYDLQKLVIANIKIAGCKSFSKAALTMQVEDKKGAVVSKKVIRPVLLSQQAQADISKLPCGDYRLSIQLVIDGQQAGSETRPFYKVKPLAKPAEMLTIKDGIPYLNGKPHMPIVLWMGTGWSYPETVSEKDIEDIASKGFTAVMPGWEFYGEDLLGTEDVWAKGMGSLPSRQRVMKSLKMTMRDILDAAYKHHIKVVPTLSWVWRSERLTDSQVEVGGKMVQKYREHPAVLFWLSNDETDGWTDLNLHTYKMYKELDPYRPVYLNLIYGAPSNTEAADILSTDPYPIGKTPITKVSAHADVIKNVLANRPDKTFWLVLQAFGSPGEGWPRCPSPVEERCMVFLSLNHGAKGVAYFNYTPDKKRQQRDNGGISVELWEAMGQINSQIREMSLPYLLGKVLSPAASGGKIDVAAREYNGRVYIIACNINDAPVTADITLGGFKLPAKVDVLFENRSVSTAEGGIKDSFEGFGTHIYSFAKEAR